MAPKIRRPDLKAAGRKLLNKSKREQLVELKDLFKPIEKVSTRKKREKRSLKRDENLDIRRRTTHKDAIKVFNCRHSLPNNRLVGWRTVASKCSLPTMTCY